VKETFCRESLSVIRKEVSISIHSETGGRRPDVIIHTYTSEVALAEKVSVFNNTTPREFTYKQKAGFPLSSSKHPVL